MKIKILILLVFVNVLNVYSDIALKDIKSGYKIKSDKIYLVGQIDPGVDMRDFFEGYDLKNLWMRLVFNEDVNAKAFFAFGVKGQTISGYKYGKYFILELARKKINLVNVAYTPKTGSFELTSLEFEPKLELNYEKDDSFLYVGLLRFEHSDDGKKTVLSVIDDYDDCLKLYSNYLKNKNNEFIIPLKKMFIGGGEISAEVITRKLTIIRN